MDRVTETIMQLVNSEICGKPLSLTSDICLTDAFLAELLLLSRKHGIAQIVASALINNGYLENSPQKGLFMNEIYSAVYVYEKMNAVFNEVCSAFEKDKIPYIPLKGAVIRSLYPQPWMRSSCDIDILVKETDLQSAIDSLNGLEGYTQKGESKHDVIFTSSDGIVIEIHYKLLGDKKSPFYTGVLSSVWDSAVIQTGYEYRYLLSDTIFYYYHILHMAKHLRIGGCGIRPFIDLWLMTAKCDCDTEEIKRVLKQGRLLKFENSVRDLNRVWFSDEKHTDTTIKLQKFVVSGGMFGSAETRLASDFQRKGGIIGHIFSRIFVPYDYLKKDYPVLEKYPFLTPWCEIRRLFSLLFGKKKKNKDTYIEKLNNETDNQNSNNTLLFKDIGLK